MQLYYKSRVSLASISVDANAIATAARSGRAIEAPVVRGALLLDAGMSVQAAGRRLAQHGYWIDPNQPSARSWLKEYVAQIAEFVSRAGAARPDASDRASGRGAATSTADGRREVPTLEEAARLLARPAEHEWAAVRRQDGVTIFLTSHNLAEVEKTCSLVAVIDRGRIKAFGELQHVLHAGARPRAQFVGAALNEELRHRLESRPEVALATLTQPAQGQAVLDVELRTDTSVAPLVELLVNAGARLEEVRRVTPTLESAYLRYMDDRP